MGSFEPNDPPGSATDHDDDDDDDIPVDGDYKVAHKPCNGLE